MILILLHHPAFSLLFLHLFLYDSLWLLLASFQSGCFEEQVGKAFAVEEVGVLSPWKGVGLSFFYFAIS